MNHLEAIFKNNTGPSGEIGQDAVAELQKALSAGYGTDQAALTGGGALRIQSLEATMLSTIQENEHFRLFNALNKSNATATVDEWTEHNGIGGFLGGSTNSEAGIIPSATGQYKRRVGMVKYMMTRREVTLVASLQNSIVEAEATEYNAGALQLLTDAEYLSFEGDSSVVPTEFDGIEAQVTAFAGADHTIDARATPLDNVIYINNAAALIAGYGNFGRPTDIFTSQAVQADFDSNLDPAFRVPLTDVGNGGIQIGAPVRGIRTSWGDIKNQPDVFIRDEVMRMPFEVVQNGAYSAQAVANNYKPAAVAVTHPANAAAQFQVAQLGSYYYAVAGTGASGPSQAFVTDVAAIAAGEAGSLSITPSATGLETGYIIYRGRKDGTNALTDLREVKRIPRNANPASPTVFVDLNLDIPGTTKAYILNLTPGAKAITWRQFLPMMKFPLYPTNAATIPWAQLLFGFLRLGKARHHVVIKNILPTTQVWRPFG